MSEGPGAVIGRPSYHHTLDRGLVAPPLHYRAVGLVPCRRVAGAAHVSKGLQRTTQVTQGLRQSTTQERREEVRLGGGACVCPDLCAMS